MTPRFGNHERPSCTAQTRVRSPRGRLVPGRAWLLGLARDTLSRGTGLRLWARVSGPRLDVVSIGSPVDVFGGDVGSHGWVQSTGGDRVVVQVLLGADRNTTLLVRETSSGSGLGSDGLLLLSLNLFRVTVEEHVDHDAPAVRSVGGLASESEDLSAEEPPEETNGLDRLVVAWDGNVDVTERSVGVAEGDDGDVGVGSLTDGLVVDSWVSDNNDSGLLEGSDDLVSEGTGGESSGNGSCAGVGGELEDGSVTESSSGDDDDLGEVLDGCDDSGCEDELGPSLTNVQEVNAWSRKE